MSWSRKAWIVATSVAAVEVLKDQGICRWNHVIRSIHQHAKNNIHKSLSQANTKDLSSASYSATETTEQLHLRADAGEQKKQRKTEESIQKVMNLSCFGPNRF